MSTNHSGIVYHMQKFIVGTAQSIPITIKKEETALMTY
jgi:hypothetical protein